MSIPVAMYPWVLPGAKTVVLGLFPSELTLSSSPSALLLKKVLSQCSRPVPLGLGGLKPRQTEGHASLLRVTRAQLEQGLADSWECQEFDAWLGQL